MKKKHILLFGIVVVGLVFFFAFINVKTSPIERMKCIKLGGKYESLSVPLGAPSQYACIHSFTDGRKICTNNNDCQGNCLITEDTLLEKNKDKSKILFSPKVIGGTGECEHNDRRHPCYPGDFENSFGWCI